MEKLNWIAVLLEATLLAWPAPRVLAETQAEVEGIIQKYDRNRDGLLDRDELTAYFHDQALQQFDKNKDGRIEGAEVDALLSEKAEKLSDQGDAQGRLNKQDLIRLFEKAEDEQGFIADMAKVVSLRRSFFGADADTEPAHFSWTQTRDDSSYTIDGAVSLVSLAQWQSFRLGDDWNMKIEPEPTFEAHVSTEKDAASDSLTARLPFRFILAPSDPTGKFFKSHVFCLSAVYETDSDCDTRSIRLEPLYTPNIEVLAIGQRMKLFGDRSAVSFRWRPYVGAEMGRVLDPGDANTAGDSRDFTNLVLRLYGEVWFGERFVVTADFVEHCTSQGERRTYQYGEISPILYVDKFKHLSVGMSFKDGMESQTSQDVRSLSLWAGLKF
jgi:hypothetical protein